MGYRDWKRRRAAAGAFKDAELLCYEDLSQYFDWDESQNVEFKNETLGKIFAAIANGNDQHNGRLAAKQITDDYYTHDIIERTNNTSLEDDVLLQAANQLTMFRVTQQHNGWPKEVPYLITLKAVSVNQPVRVRQKSIMQIEMIGIDNHHTEKVEMTWGEKKISKERASKGLSGAKDFALKEGDIGTLNTMERLAPIGCFDFDPKKYQPDFHDAEIYNIPQETSVLRLQLSYPKPDETDYKGEYFYICSPEFFGQAFEMVAPPKTPSGPVVPQPPVPV